MRLQFSLFALALAATCSSAPPAGALLSPGVRRTRQGGNHGGTRQRRRRRTRQIQLQREVADVVQVAILNAPLIDWEARK